MSAVPRARVRPGSRRRHPRDDLRRALLVAAELGAAEPAVHSVEERVGIFSRILIEGARSKE